MKNKNWYEEQKEKILTKYKGDNQAIKESLINIGYTSNAVNKILSIKNQK